MNRAIVSATRDIPYRVPVLAPTIRGGAGDGVTAGHSNLNRGGETLDVGNVVALRCELITRVWMD